MHKTNQMYKKYEELFLAKNQVLNLISKNDEKNLYTKHFKDSLSIELFFQKYGKDFKTLLDIGTGGGFPALPVAMNYPEIKVTGVDSIRKKITAISDIARDLELENFETICTRVEEIKDRKFDLITSRAVAKLEILIKYALPLLNKKGYLIAYKSRNVKEEIQEAEMFLKKYKAKIIDVIEYKLEADEIFERNLVIIKHA